MSISISNHAVRRFIERMPEDTKINDLKKAKKKIDRLFKMSFEAPIDPVFRVRALINNGFKETVYRYFNGYVFTVIGNTVVTVFRGKFKKGEIIPLIHQQRGDTL